MHKHPSTRPPQPSATPRALALHVAAARFARTSEHVCNRARRSARLVKEC